MEYKLGYFLKNSFFEYSPFIAWNNKEKLRLLLHPVFPHKNTGILLIKQTKSVNKLSNKALFFAIPKSKYKLLANSFSNLSG